MPSQKPAVVGTLSASAIVGGTVTGHHLLQVECYSHTKELPSGQFVRSPPFSVGGRSWRILYYPNGENPSVADFVSIYLCLDESVAALVKARVMFSLLDQAGEPAPLHSSVAQMRFFCYSTGGHGYSTFINRAWLEKSNYLRDDGFTIRCDVTVVKELRAEERRPLSPFVVVPPSDLHCQIGDLLASGEGADVTFQVAGETFQAHRCVLAARSSVFKAEVFDAMQEGRDGAVIRMDDMDAQVFKALLDFMYTDALPDPDCSDAEKKQEDAAMAQHLLVAADRYNLQRLKLICEDRLCDHIDTASAAAMFVLAEQHSCRGLKEACIKFLSYPLILKDVMATDGFDHLISSCPSVLKELISNIKHERRQWSSYPQRAQRVS